MAGTDAVKVLIVEDNPVERLVIKTVVESMDGFELVGEAEDGQAGVDQALNLKPTLVLMDIGLPVIDGVEATRQIKDSLPDTRVLIATRHEDEEKVCQAISAGMDGYYLKTLTDSNDALKMAIRTVAFGGAWFDPAIAGRTLKFLSNEVPEIAESTAGMPNRGIESLTQVEREVLDLLTAGLGHSEIAGRMEAEPAQVAEWVQRIMKKVTASHQVQEAIARILKDLPRD